MGRKLTTEEFVAKSKLIHKNSRLDYSEVNYQGSTIKVKIICLDHGPFMQTPSQHLVGSIGCKPCAGIKSKETNKKRNNERFIKNVKEKYPDGNFGFDLVEYEGSKTKVKIYCKKH